MQVLPAGQSVSEEYDIEYGTIKDDPDGSGQDRDYNVGPPLTLRYELSDNVISEKQSSQLRIFLHNPSNNRLRGQVEVTGETNYPIQGKITTVNFDLSPGETTTANVTLPGNELVAGGGINPRTTKFNAKANIWNDPYTDLGTQKEDFSADDMTLTIRKPLWARFGLYWLGFLSICLGGGTYLLWKKYDGEANIL